MRELTSDEIEYLGKVVEWLKSAPEMPADTMIQHYVTKVEIAYGVERIGTFTNEDENLWLYAPAEAG